MKKISVILSALSCALMLSAPSVQAKEVEGYPSKNIRLMIAYPAGGGTDTLGRVLAPELSKELGGNVYVENKPGASGHIGTNMVIKAPADGHELLLGITALSQTPWLYDNLTFDPKEDLEPVSQMASSGDVFVINSKLGIDTFEDFVDYAKKNPGKLSYGSYGQGTSSHLHGEQLNLQKDLDLMHVPYKGSGPLVTSLLSQDLTVGFVDTSGISAHLDSDKFNILAVTGAKRLKSLPDVRTFEEIGLKGFENNGWFGFFVKKGTPEEITNLLSEKIEKIKQLPEVKEKIENLGLVVAPEGREHFKNQFDQSYKTYGEIIKNANITID